MDRRIAKSKQVIRETFLSLLQHQELHKISIVELSQKANIGRGTFYLHYQDIYDLYHQIETEFYEGLIEYFDLYYPNDNSDDLLQLVEACTQFIEKNQEIFRILVAQDHNGRSLTRLKDLLIKKILFGHTQKKRTTFEIVEVKFIVSGVVGIFEEWRPEEVNWSQKEVTKMLHKLLVKLL